MNPQSEADLYLWLFVGSIMLVLLITGVMYLVYN